MTCGPVGVNEQIAPVQFSESGRVKKAVQVAGSPYQHSGLDAFEALCLITTDVHRLNDMDRLVAAVSKVPSRRSILRAVSLMPIGERWALSRDLPDEGKENPATPDRDQGHVLERVAALNHNNDRVRAARVKCCRAFVVWAGATDRDGGDRRRVELRRRGNHNRLVAERSVLDRPAVDGKLEHRGSSRSDAWARGCRTAGSG